MSNKIKISLSDNKTKIRTKKEDSIHKITIKLGNQEKKNSTIIVDNKKPDYEIKEPPVFSYKSDTIKNKSVLQQKELYKLFKKNNYSRLDLHGHSLESAKQKLIEYCNQNSSMGNQLHIIVTGLGNKANNSNFFSGKIRHSFIDWIKEPPLNTTIKSYSQCKIQHGGLGAFYIKIKTIK